MQISTHVAWKTPGWIGIMNEQKQCLMESTAWVMFLIFPSGFGKEGEVFQRKGGSIFIAGGRKRKAAGLSAAASVGRT